MSNFTVDILTPSRVLVRDLPADQITVPTVCGAIQILPGHTHIIEKLDTGVLEVVAQDKKSYFVVTTGICKLLNNKLQIIANVAEKSNEIDKDRAQKALEKAKAKLAAADQLTADELVKYQRKLARAEIRLHILLSNN